MRKTDIGWCDYTWNPVFGCSKVSAGCDNCYAERIALKHEMSAHEWTGEFASENVQLKPHKLDEPLRQKEPRRIFVNSMSDTFHPRVPDSYIDEMFEVMAKCPQHIFMLLTKRPGRAAQWPKSYSRHIWMGTSVESKDVTHRIPTLRGCGKVGLRFLSVEPLLEDIIPLDLSDIGWVIVGGESGPNRRPMAHSWARGVRDACVKQVVPFYFKQSASEHAGNGDRLRELDGTATLWKQVPHEWAAHLATQPTQLSLF